MSRAETLMADLLLEVQRLANENYTLREDNARKHDQLMDREDTIAELRSMVERAHGYANYGVNLDQQEARKR